MADSDPVPPPSSNDDDNNNNNAKDDGEEETESTVTLHLTVTGQPGAPRVPLVLPMSATPSELRRRTSAATTIPLEGLRLIFRGRLVVDGDAQPAVTEYKLEEGSVLHCMGKPVSSSKPGTTAAANTTGVGPAPSAAAVPFATAVPTGTSTPSTAAAATTSADPLQAALQVVRASAATPATYQTAVATLDKILSNIIDHPLESKYRQLKVHNPAFQRRLGGLPGGDSLMQAAGFVRETIDEDECYVLQANSEAWPRLVQTKATVAAIVRQASVGAAAPPSLAAARANPLLAAALGAGAGGSLAGGGGFPGGGAVPPGMESAVADVMSDPQALQAMFQNPMVQAMMRNDPRLANNPAMRQVMDELATNPQAAEQLSMMMRDPSVRNYLQSAMASQGPGAGGGLGGGFGGGAGAGAGGGFPPALFNPSLFPGGANGLGGRLPAGSAPPQQQRQPPASGGAGAGASDEDMTEEEMIAEAIRRSLQDNQ